MRCVRQTTGPGPGPGPVPEPLPEPTKAVRHVPFEASRLTCVAVILIFPGTWTHLAAACYVCGPTGTGHDRTWRERYERRTTHTSQRHGVTRGYATRRTHLAHSNTQTRIATTRLCGARASHCHGRVPHNPHCCYRSRKPACHPAFWRRAGAAHTTPGAATSPLASPGSELANEPSLLEDAALAGREAARFCRAEAPAAARAAAARVATTARRSCNKNSRHRMDVRQSRCLL